MDDEQPNFLTPMPGSYSEKAEKQMTLLPFEPAILPKI